MKKVFFGLSITNRHQNVSSVRPNPTEHLKGYSPAGWRLAALNVCGYG